MFDASVNDYLSYYTQGIFASEISPYENMPSKYINGILYIPSNLEQYYCLEFYYSDTKNREHVRFCYKDALDITRGFPGYSSSADYYADLDHNNHHCKIYFSPSYLKSKDKETADRNINLKLLFQYASTDDFADPIDTEPFYLNCVVNTPPEILEDNYTYCKLIVDGVKRNILCFNIKPEEENLYGDLKNSNGNYTIRINGTQYEFYFDTTTHKPVFQGTNKFYSSISSIPGGSGLETPEGGFEAKTNPVYFVTDENTEKLYEILIVDNHGLEKKYTISTKPSGKQKLNLSVSEGIDSIEITPDFTAVPQKQGETPITVNNLILVYTIDDGELQQKNFNNNDTTPFTIYVPGGTERINYYMKTDQPDINQSEHKETKFTLQKKIYVKPTPEDSNYRGGTSDTPWNIKDALEYLGHQTGEWTLDVGSGEYKAMSEADIDAVGEAFIYVKKDPSVNVKINIEGESDTQRATFNANSIGRVFSANGVPVSLKYVNIAGGNYDKNGAGVVSNNSLSLENCNIYGNTSTICQSSDPEFNDGTGHGGGIYKSGTTLLYVKNCKVYSNESKRKGAGIFVNSSTVYIENTKIYDNKSGTWGGGIWNQNGNVYIYGGSIIGTASDDTAQYTENLGKYSNRAGSGGGGIYSKKGTINIGYYLDEEQELTEDDEHTNSVIYNTANYGGGIYCDRALVRMYKGIINCNYGYQGGGVYLYKSSDDLSKFNIKDSSMSKNNVSNKGGAVYVEDKEKTVFMPMGTVTIDSSSAKNNDVYLYYETDPQKTPVDTAISLNSSSELDSSSHISITPGSYSDTNPKLVGIAVADIAQKYKCFSVTKSGNTEYFLNPKAVLTTYQPAETLPDNYSVSSGKTLYVWSGADITRIAALSKNYDFTGATVKLLDNIQTSIRDDDDQIGSSDKPFNGIFDGNSKEINCSNNTDAIFHITGGSAEIKNIKLTGSVTLNDSVPQYPALLIALMKGGKIEDCKNYCSLTITTGVDLKCVGALVSQAQKNSDETAYAELNKCINYAYVNVTCTEQDSYGCVGGLVGSSAGCNFTNCAQRNYVKGGKHAGGLLGKFAGYTTASTFRNCYVSANVTSTVSGGFAGGLTNSHLTYEYPVEFYNCYYMGTLYTNNGSSGGFVGNDYGANPNSNTLKFSNCILVQNYYTGNATYEPNPEEGTTIEADSDTITKIKNKLNSIANDNENYTRFKNLNNRCVFDDETQ
jgi:hypothetical protein